MTAASTRARCGSDEDYQPSVLPTDSAEDPEFREQGYFAHAAVGIPESQYDGMTSAVAPVFEEYRRLTSAGQREIKHTEFKRLAVVAALAVRDVRGAGAAL